MWIIGGAVGFLVLLIWSRQKPDFPDGIQVHAFPVQYAVSEPTFRLNAWTVTPLARYDIEAIVLHTLRYRFGKFSEFSPLDVAMGWGPMSDGTILDPLGITQGDRFFRWARNDLLPHDEINRHAANVHVIPSNKKTRRELFRLAAGDHVRITGVLISAKSDDGYSVRSSLTREDTGAGACEILWVDKVEHR